MLNAVVGFAGLPATLAALEAGQAARAREQGEPDRGRARSSPRRAPRAAARSSPSTPSTRRSGSACASGRASEVGRIVLTASGGPFRGRTRERAARRSRSPTRSRTPRGTWARRSRRQLDVDEQGPRGDRGARAVRRRLRPHRRGGASAVDRAQHGRVLRRRDDRAAVDARHAPADRARARRARPAARGVRRDRLVDARAASTSRSPTSRPSRASRSRTRPAGPGAPRPRSSSAANEVAVEAFLGGRIAWTEIADVVEEVLERRRRNRR